MGGRATGRPGSRAEASGVTPGSPILWPVAGLTPSIRLELSRPPCWKVLVLTAPPPQCMPQASESSFRYGRGRHPTQFGPEYQTTRLGDQFVKPPGNHTQPRPGIKFHPP